MMISSFSENKMSIPNLNSFNLHMDHNMRFLVLIELLSNEGSASMCKCADSPGHSLLAYTKYECRQIINTQTNA